MMRPALMAAFTVITMCTATVARADYPVRNITIVVPYTPGGTVDVLARILGRELGKAWGQSIVIDNRPGAGGSLGAQVVARAQPDGYTLLLSTNSPLTTNPVLYKSLGYDPLKDFEPVVVAGENSMLLVAAPALPAQSLAELIALAKSKPGAVSAGTSGNGATTHLSLAEFMKWTGAEIVHVPYRGGMPSLTGAMAGEVEITFSDIVPAMPLVRSGKLKAYGTTGSKRANIAPEIPTLAEQGLKDFNIVAWVAMVAPKGTPKEIIVKLNTEINRLLADTKFRTEMTAIGIDPIGGTAEEFRTFLANEIPRWKAIVQEAGVKVD